MFMPRYVSNTNCFLLTTSQSPALRVWKASDENSNSLGYDIDIGKGREAK